MYLYVDDKWQKFSCTNHPKQFIQWFGFYQTNSLSFKCVKALLKDKQTTDHKNKGQIKYGWTNLKRPGRLSVKQNVFDQIHKPQASQGQFFQQSLKPYHEQPVIQPERLHLQCPVSLHHHFLHQDFQQENHITWLITAIKSMYQASLENKKCLCCAHTHLSISIYFSELLPLQNKSIFIHQSKQVLIKFFSKLK